ncbi:hypothetical protein [Luteitalea sp.]
MSPAGIDQLAQHVGVFIVALLAAGVVARRVFGVFERRPDTTGIPHGTGAAGCSHCAAGSAAAKKHAPR